MYRLIGHVQSAKGPRTSYDLSLSPATTLEEDSARSGITDVVYSCDSRGCF